MSFEFLVTALVVVLLPGTGVLYTLAIGLGKGFQASIAAAVGCTLGIVPAALASIVGLAALLHTSALAFQILKYLGVLYLFYMAWGILKDGGSLDVTEDRSQTSYYQIALNGCFLNILNPKLSLFFLAFLPQFVAPGNGAGQLLYLALAFMLITLFVFVVYGLSASLARDYIITRPRVMIWIKRIFAGTFAGLGLKLAFTRD